MGIAPPCAPVADGRRDVRIIDGGYGASNANGAVKDVDAVVNTHTAGRLQIDVADKTGAAAVYYVEFTPVVYVVGDVEDPQRAYSAGGPTLVQIVYT